MSKVPEYADLKLTIYLTNSEIDCAMSVSGQLSLEGLDYEGIAQKFIEQLNELTGLTDTRVMTREEVKAYIESQDE